LLISLATAAAISGVIARCSVLSQNLAELAHGQAGDLAEGRSVEAVQNQLRDVVGGRVDQGVVDDLGQGEVGQHPFGGDSLALGTGGDSGQAVARLLLVGPGEDVAQAVEAEPLGLDGGDQGQRMGLAR
jgi:hypothetical protein